MGLTRRFLFNDASWEGQCPNADRFRECIRFCLEIDAALRRVGGGLEVGYYFRARPVGYVPTVAEALRELRPDQRTRVLLWLDKHGPFWDRPSRHNPIELFECLGEVVTETALAEAALLTAEGDEPVLVSLPTSRFTAPSLTVVWHDGPEGTLSLSVKNAATLEGTLQHAQHSEQTFTNYRELITWAQRKCRHLALVRRSLLEQMGTTFVPAVARRGRELFAALNAIAEARVNDDQPLFASLCREWLAGERFSDSSATEKNDPIFSQRLRFKHPCTGEYLHCFWHGKIRTSVFRLHFEWPPPWKSRKLYVAYLGPKLTKK